MPDNNAQASLWPIATFSIYIATLFQIGYLILQDPRFIPLIGLTDWLPSTIAIFICLIVFYQYFNFSKLAVTWFSPELRETNKSYWIEPPHLVDAIFLLGFGVLLLVLPFWIGIVFLVVYNICTWLASNRGVGERRPFVLTIAAGFLSFFLGMVYSFFGDFGCIVTLKREPVGNQTTTSGSTPTNPPPATVTAGYLRPIADGHLMRSNGIIYFRPKDQVQEIVCGGR